MRSPFVLALGWIFCWLVSAAPASAHALNTSYARTEIDRGGVSFILTYDLATLGVMTPRAWPEPRLSPREFAAALPAIEQFLRNRVLVDLNGQNSDLGVLTAPIWPNADGGPVAAADYAQTLVSFRFRHPLMDAPQSVQLIFDFFPQLGGQHTVLGVFAWLGHEQQVVFTRFEPDYDFVTGYIVSPLRSMGQYLKLGIEHIVSGYDHVAFLLGLMFVRRLADLLKIVTAFTGAHALSLTLAALKIVNLPARPIEIAIAGTIVYLAAENIWAQNQRPRWPLAFGFGLIHGLGFSSVLAQLGLPSFGFARSLFAFNLGVELGQLGIVLVLWPLFWWLAQQNYSAWARRVLSAPLLLFGAVWLGERVLGMPFALR